MSNRRDLGRAHGANGANQPHHPDHDHRDAHGRDPWEALGPEQNQSGRVGADDFWGDVPDWSAQASTARRTGRGRIGASIDEPVDPTPIGMPAVERTGLAATIGRAWGQLLGGGGDITREHRRVDAAALPPEAPDEYDDYDATRNAAPLASAEPVDQVGPAPRTRTRTPIDAVEQQWVAEAAAAPARPSPIDPLLTRIGALIIVTALVVPLLLSITSSDGSDDAAGSVGSADAAAAAVTVPAPTLLPTPTTVPGAPAVVDPASLPPAVPVNTEAPSAPSQSGAAELSAPDDATSHSDASSASDAPVSASSSSIDEAALDAVDSPAVADAEAARVDPPVCPVPYTVVAGDFWLRLADAANVELADLLAVNRATVNTPLFPGGEICLPEGATTPAPPVTTTEAPASTTPVTTPSTTTAPTTTEAPAAEPPGPDDIKQIIRDVWPDELEDRALEIAYRESRFVPTAKNFCCYGLFQIYWEVHDVWLDDIGITSASQLYDPETNARAAYALYQRAGGWGPWQL